MDPIRYTLGLDIGIASVGWAVLRNDINGEPIKIERLGSRIFTEAENPDDGSSLAAPRRKARGARRNVRRCGHRKDRIKLLLEKKGIMPREEIDSMFEESGFEETVYELRTDALDRALTNEEAVRILINYAQRRGYKSNSKSAEAKDKDKGKVLSAISENEARMAANHYRTVGEMFWKDPQFKRVLPDGSVVLCVHNEPDNYKMTVSREMNEKEIRTVFKRQRELGAAWATEDLESEYLEIWGSQRNFDEGPGGDSPYGGSQIEKMLGKCTFEKDEPRVPKACYTAEYFQLLQTVNNIKTYRFGEDPVFLSKEQREKVIELALKSPSLNYSRIRKELKLEDDVFFNTITYKGSSVKSSEEKTKLKAMQFYHEMRKTLDKIHEGYIDELSTDQLDEIGRIITLYKSDDNRRKHFAEMNLPEDVVERLLSLSASKAFHLSLKAMKKLLPYMERGQTYHDACMEVYGSTDGISHNAVRSTKLSINDIEGISNPVVVRAVSQTIKVINAIVRVYGPPEIVRIELARELGKSKKDRDRIADGQKKNAARNDKIYNQIQEYKKGGKPTGQDIVKFKLFEEQDGVCLYSGESLDISRLFEPGYVDVDHIFPYSKCFDDGYNNKVLVRASENRQKGNRTPYEYFGQDLKRWGRFEALVESKVHNYKKKQKLLSKASSDERKDEFTARNLEDTQYLSRVIYNLVNDHLQFAETGIYKKRTQPVNGAITAEVRKRLGIEKIREEGDLHHAVDAVVIACISPGMVKKITDFSERHELEYNQVMENGYLDRETGEVLTKAEYEEKYAPHFPEPWDHFRDELEARISDHPQEEIERLHLDTYEDDETVPVVFVSRTPKRKLSGAGHEETIRSGKKPGYTITKTALTNLKLDKKTGEIIGYYNKESDPLLYNALKERLELFNGNAEEAFAEPFYKPKANGEPGPLVKKVKIEEKASLCVDTGRGLANNGRMVRVDVFYVNDDGYYFVPVYVADTLKRELPNRAVVQSKPYEKWKIMKDSDFICSLYPNDLVYIVKQKGFKMNLNKDAVGKSNMAKEILVTDSYLYFEGINIANGNLKISTHDRRYNQGSLGGKTLDLIEKCEVDVLGNISKIRLPEERKTFRN